jgi:hypothetical protein
VGVATIRIFDAIPQFGDFRNNIMIAGIPFVLAGPLKTN